MLEVPPSLYAPEKLFRDTKELVENAAKQEGAENGKMENNEG
jgi:hypothetical protein